MDLTSEGYYEEKLAKAKSAMKPVVKALHEHRNAENQTIPMISLIREMQGEGAESWRIKNVLSDGADYGCPDAWFQSYPDYTKKGTDGESYVTNELWESTHRIINKHVDYQLSLGKGRGMRM